MPAQIAGTQSKARGEGRRVMARTMGSLEVVIESTPQDGEPGWSVYVVRSHRRFAAGGLAVAHETLKDAEWFADQVFEIITGKRV